jgi:hypothetical protein
VNKGLSSLGIAASVAAFGLVACSGSTDKQHDAAGGASASAASAVVTADSIAHVTAAARTIAAGTAIEATIQEPVSSRTNHVGQAVKAIVSRNVLDAGGAVAIPGGAPIVLAIAALHAANSAGAADGSISFTMTSVSVRDTSYAPSTHVGAVGQTVRPSAASNGNRELLVAPGTPVTITLTHAFKMAAK